MSSVISNKLSNVLCPVVDLVTSETKVVTTKSIGSDNKDGVDTEIKVHTNVFRREVVDTEFHELCGNALYRNAEMITRVLRANLEKTCKAISDYNKHRDKESHKSGSNMAY